MNNDLASRYAEQTKSLAAPSPTVRNAGFAAPITGKAINQTAPKPGNGFFDWAGNVGKQSLNIADSGISKLGSFAFNSAADIYKAGSGVVGSLYDIASQPFIQANANRNIDALNKKTHQLSLDYRAGKISKTDYSNSMKSIQKAHENINADLKPFIDGPSLKEREIEIVETAANVLTLGRYSTVEALAKTGAKGIIDRELPQIVTTAASKVDNLITKVPAVKELVNRNVAQISKAETSKLAGESLEQYMAREGKRVVAGLLIKRPVFYQTNIEGTQDIYNKLSQGQIEEGLKSAIWLGTQMVGGGPVGTFLKKGEQASGKLKALALGKGSYIDEISKQIGDGNPSQIRRFLQTVEKRAPDTFKDVEKTFRILQETNLQNANERLDIAVQNTLTHYQQHGIDLSTVTPSQLYKDMSKWAKADELAQSTIKSGLIKDVPKEEAEKYVVVRWDKSAKQGLANAIEGAGNNFQAIAKAIYDMADSPGVGWGNNEILMKRIDQAVNQGGTAKDIAKRIREIPTATTMLEGIPKKVRDQLAELGYTIAAPFGGRKTAIVTYDDTRKLVTGAIQKGNEVFDAASSPSPTLSAISGGLDKLGLSLQSSNDIAYSKLSESLVANLDQVAVGKNIGLVGDYDVTNGGKAILSKLQAYIENKKPLITVGGIGKVPALTDIRQLRIGEIQESLSITKDQAKTISKSINDAYTKVPLEFRGLGDKVVDTLYKYNPAQKYYSRIQSALRYTYNPFFRTQERIETALLSRVKGHNLIWMQSRPALDQGARLLDEGGFFTTGLSGEAAQDQVFGRITANLSQGQKRDLAGLGMKIAESKGVTLSKMITDHPDELEDALKVIVQYPSKGLISSPMARTLNLAFFPMRYNTKVTMLAAKELAKAPPSVQLAAVNSFLSMKDWLKSDEGIRWQSDHSDALQVLKWATPYGSIEQFYKVATGNVQSPGDLGLLGGLPVGVISQILDSQGIIDLNTPYVNPKTGDTYPDYIPQSTKARAAVALNDLFGSLFTYPGRILGLPGKEETLRKAVDAFIDTNGSDFEKRYQDQKLTPLQQNMVRVLKGDTSEEAIDALYQSPAPGQYNGYTLPPLNLPTVVAPTEIGKSFDKRTGLPSGKKISSKGKKKALPIPARQSQ